MRVYEIQFKIGDTSAIYIITSWSFIAAWLIGLKKFYRLYRYGINWKSN